jgi:hypothetical protein
LPPAYAIRLASKGMEAAVTAVPDKAAAPEAALA